MSTLNYDDDDDDPQLTAARGRRPRSTARRGPRTRGAGGTRGRTGPGLECFEMKGRAQIESGLQASVLSKSTLQYRAY